MPALALGANLWILGALLPLYLGVREHPPGLATAFVVALALIGAPLLLVAGSLWRSPALLLGAYPLAALLPQALAEAAQKKAPPALLLLAVWLGYVAAVLRALNAAPATVARPLPAEITPVNWTRRVAAAQLLLALVVPALLVGCVFLPSVQRNLVEHFERGASAVSALLILIAGLLALVAVRRYAARPLELLLTQPRAAARRAPRRRFFVWVGAALALMIAAVLWSRP